MTNQRKNRIEEALKLRGVKQVELVEKTGIKKASINHWIKQRYQPKQDSLYKMAKVLNVSELWLAGYNVPMERPLEQMTMDELSQLINTIKKDKRLTKLVINLGRLTPDQLNAVEKLINEFIKLNQC